MTSFLSYVLNVLDDNYNVKHVSTIDFLEKMSSDNFLISMAINGNNDIIMIREDGPNVYVCDSSGKLKHKF